MQPERYRNNNDPISLFDRGAKSYERPPDPKNKLLGTIASVVGTALTGNEESGKTAGSTVDSVLNMWTTHADYHNIPEANNRLYIKYTK